MPLGDKQGTIHPSLYTCTASYPYLSSGDADWGSVKLQPPRPPWRSSPYQVIHIVTAHHCTGLQGWWRMVEVVVINDENRRGQKKSICIHNEFHPSQAGNGYLFLSGGATSKIISVGSSHGAG